MAPIQGLEATPEALSALSHELRSPVSTIVLWVQLLRQGRFDASGGEPGLAAIERAARSLVVALENLVDFSRVAGGERLCDRSPADLAVVLAGAVDRSRGQADAKDVALRLEPAASCLALVDGPRLARALGTLIADVVRRSTRGQTVRARLLRVGRDAQVWISAGGPGARAPTRTAEAPRADTAGALSVEQGLGLTVATAIVDAHGGRVLAGARRDEGLMVLLPLETPVIRVAAPARSATARPADLAGMRVLVVDDAADAREALRLLLEGWGAVVTTAGSADEAFACLRDVRPEVLLSDIAMPGQDGYHLIRRVRALPASAGGRVPAAALTALSSREDRRRLLSAGYQDHLVKPVEPAALKAAIVALVAQRH